MVQTFFVLALHAVIFLKMQTKTKDKTLHQTLILVLRLLLGFTSIVFTAFSMITIFDYDQPFPSLFYESSDSIDDSDYD